MGTGFRRWVILVALGFACLSALVVFPVWTSAAPDHHGNPMADEQLQAINTNDLNAFWNDLLQKYGGYLPYNASTGFGGLVTGGGLSLQGVLEGLARFFLNELWQNSKLLGTILVLTVFASVLETLQSAFEHHAVSKIAYGVSYLVILVLAVNSFSSAIGFAREAIDSMVNFMIAMIPVVLALLTSVGALASVAMFHPLIVFVIHIIGNFIYVIIFPLIFFAAVLDLVSALSERYKVTNLANLLRTVSIGLLGFFLSVFLGVISVRGAAGAVADGVTLRTTKFVTATFVPVVGKMFSDATGTVIGASMLVKNAVGIAGMVVLLLICAFPSIKIISLALMYNMSAALMQPLGGSPIIQCLNTIGKSLILVFAAVASVGLMFFLAVTIIIAAGNLTVMVR
jgi:stage III sporulation protein AE